MQKTEGRKIKTAQGSKSGSWLKFCYIVARSFGKLVKVAVFIIVHFCGRPEGLTVLNLWNCFPFLHGVRLLSTIVF